LVREIVGDIEDGMTTHRSSLVPLGEAWDADARAELKDVAETIDDRASPKSKRRSTRSGLAFVLAGTSAGGRRCCTTRAVGASRSPTTSHITRLRHRGPRW
jgi:CBS domain containing-hemolysin-like protein